MTRLPDGTRVSVRPLRADDGADLAQAYLELSPASQHARFLSPLRALTPALLHRLVDHVDGVHHVALVLVVHGDGGDEDVAIARFVRDPRAPYRAEMAVTVADRWQGRGVGRALVAALRDEALRLGVECWTATLLHGNTASVRLLEGAGEVVRRTPAGPGAVELEVRLAA